MGRLHLQTHSRHSGSADGMGLRWVYRSSWQVPAEPQLGATEGWEVEMLVLGTAAASRAWLPSTRTGPAALGTGSGGEAAISHQRLTVHGSGSNFTSLRDPWSEGH